MSIKAASTQDRKADHVALALHERSDAGLRLFEHWQWIPQALPELSRASIDLSTTLHGWKLDLPLWIAGMTGGMERGEAINRDLATAAEQAGIPMGLGSLKVLIEHPETLSQFQMKRHHPRLRLIGNLGLHALNYGVTEEEIFRLRDVLELDAFAFHVNALQESIQPEGQTDFSDLLRRLESLTRRLGIPVWVKEVGSGVSPLTFRRLAECGVAVVDIGGRGGTNWSTIEGARAESAGLQLQARLGEVFQHWGLTTEESLIALQPFVSQANVPAIAATGGIRNGFQAATALALGAQVVGAARPFLQAALSGGADAVLAEIEFFAEGLRTVLFCAGIQDLRALAVRRSDCIVFRGNS